LTKARPGRFIFWREHRCADNLFANILNVGYAFTEKPGCPKGKPNAGMEIHNREGTMKKISSMLCILCLVLASYGCWDYERRHDYRGEERHEQHQRNDYRDRNDHGDRGHDQYKDRDQRNDRDDRHGREWEKERRDGND
jgi:hypothetical protein